MTINQVHRSERALKAVLEIDPENDEAKELLRRNI
jgi:hypothetical protein